VFLKFQKSPLTVFFIYNISWLVFKLLGKGLERYIDQSKAWKAAFACVLLQSFEKFPVDSYYEPPNVVHDNHMYIL